MTGRPAAVLGMAAVVLFWGMNYVVTKVGVSRLPPVDFVFWRFFGTTLVAIPWMARHRPRGHQEWLRLALLGLVGVSLYQWFFNTALKLTLAANVAFLFDLSPLLTLAGHRLLGGRPARPVVLLGAVLALLGVGLLVGTSTRGSLAGDGWALAAAVAWAAFILMTERLRPTVRGAALTGWMSAFGAVGVLPFLSGVPVWKMPPSAWLPLLYTIVFVTMLGLTFWQNAVAAMGGARASLFLYLVPVVAATGGWLFLGERMTWWQVSGAGLILAGVAIAEDLGRRLRFVRPRTGKPAG
ncbi:MAG: DMT family transporter [Thermaerobacter sp.]|nr:DMT family transporter [Thermaerobacter sp.]